MDQVRHLAQHVNSQQQAWKRAFEAQAKITRSIAEQAARIENRQRVEIQKEVLRDQYRQAHGYGQVVIGTGCVGYFAIWSFVRGDISPQAHAAAALLLGISLAIYVLREVFEMMSMALATREFEATIAKRGEELTSQDLEDIATRVHARNAWTWPITLAFTLVFAVLGVLFLLYPLLVKALAAV